MKPTKLFFFFILFCLTSSLQAQNFRVQAAAFADSVSSSYFKDRGIEGVIVSRDGYGIYRYFVGSYNTLDEAEAIRKQLVTKGFPNATVIDLEVQRALYDTPCTYFAGNPGADPSLGMHVRNIYFDSGSSTLSSESIRELEQIAQTMRENPDFKLQLTGHTDAIGSAQTNQQLATTRTRVTRNYLIKRGVQADRMFLKIYGEAKPAVDNQDFYGNDLPQNRKWNRRVTLALIDESGELVQEQ
ncbi:MAG: OmpA family protein [Saprospiraceae bacterium]|jgi:outer membrane protein OmpA-like peptidoglycan-associated protein